MKVIYDGEKRKDTEINVNNITIELNSDVEVRIELNKFGELEITKAQFGNGKGSINIEPCVSNQIRIS
jgi:hypothetical protein